MRTHRDRLSDTFIDRYLQARRAPLADTLNRAPKVTRERSDKRAVEAVARAFRAGSRRETA